MRPLDFKSEEHEYPADFIVQQCWFVCGCGGYLSVEQQFLLASSAESGCRLVMTMHSVTIVWNQEMREGCFCEEHYSSEVTGFPTFF